MGEERGDNRGQSDGLEIKKKNMGWVMSQGNWEKKAHLGFMRIEIAARRVEQKEKMEEKLWMQEK